MAQPLDKDRQALRCDLFFPVLHSKVAVMRLSEFIVQEVDRIVDEWERFAATITPAANTMDSIALRDHAKVILLAASRDMNTAQTASEQQAKAEGEGAEKTPSLDQVFVERLPNYAGAVLILMLAMLCASQLLIRVITLTPR